MHTNSDIIWNIDHVTPEAPGVASLYLSPTANKPSFLAGQYLTVKLPGLGPVEGKSYSISSAPHEEFVRITIRKMGSFSRALLALKAGDTLTTSEPYGFFYPDPEETSDIIFLAGGIGITPCLSIIKHLTHTKSSRPLHLFYSSQTKEDVVFKHELTELAKHNPLLRPHYFITREDTSEEGFFTERMSHEHIETHAPRTDTSEYFLCGSMNFTKGLWKELCNCNIPAHQLYTEGFF